MEFSEVLNLVLGGGLLATVVGLFTLRATVRKANAEAETVRIDNAEHATRILIENIVEPLKQELSETREELRETKKEFGATKREMARFRKAVESANGCKFRIDCPVLFKLRDLPKGDTGRGKDRSPGIRGQPCEDRAAEDSGADSHGDGETGDTDGQPP